MLDEYFLRSCSPLSCARTLRSLPLVPTDGAPFLVPNWLWANDTRLFWPDETGVSFCNRDECISVNHLGVDASSMGFAADENEAFFDGAAACDLDDCASTYRKLEPSLPTGEPPLDGSIVTALDEDYLYQYQFVGSRIVRFKKDGTGEVQVIARDQFDVPGIAVRDGHVYWTEYVSLGRLLRCPVTGCAGDPEVVASRLDHPTALALDADYVYFEEPDPPGSANSQLGTRHISKCAITGCVTPERLTENGALSAPFVDDRSIYFLGIDYIAAVSK